VQSEREVVPQINTKENILEMVQRSPQLSTHRISSRWLGRGGPFAWPPPRLPDLTPLDYYLWGHIKTLVYETKVKSKAALHHRIFAVAECFHNHPDNIASATQFLMMHAENCNSNWRRTL